MRQSIALLQPALLSNLLVTTRKGNRLEREKRYLFWIIKREPNDRSHLIIVDPVDERSDQNDFNTCFMKIVYRSHLHVKQVSDLSMTVRVISDAVELQIDVAQTSFGGFAAKLFALGELNSVRCSLNTVVTNFT